MSKNIILMKMRKKMPIAAAAIAAVTIASFFVLSLRQGAKNSAPHPQASSSIAETASTSIPNTSPTQSSTVSVVPPPSRGIAHAMGIAAGGGLSKISTSTLNQELDQFVALGVQWVRFDIEWGDVQYGSPSGSDWSGYDRLVNALAAHNLRGLGTITYTPQWARNPGCTNGIECPPADPATFATFAAEVAARYKSYGLHYWEIWNEPNTAQFWAPKANCVSYAALLKAVYPAVKQADPNAIVVTGGLAPAATDGSNFSPTDFLSCIYANGAGASFDAVGDHPYTFPLMPAPTGTDAWAQMSITAPSLRSIMIAHGDAAKKIWITEFGAPTNGPDPRWYISEAQQAQMAISAFELYGTYKWAGPFFWYTFSDGGNSTNTNENFFGLTRYDGSTKPAYWTIKSVISAGL